MRLLPTLVALLWVLTLTDAASYSGKLPFNRFQLTPPGQIYLSLGNNHSDCVISWVSVASASEHESFFTAIDAFSGKNGSAYYGEVEYGPTLTNLNTRVKAYASIYSEARCGQTRVLHSVRIPDCFAPNDIFYRVRTVQVNVTTILPATSWSSVKTGRLPAESSTDPLNAAVIADMSSTAGSALYAIAAATQANKLDIAVHAGDMAYNLDDDCGDNGDTYMSALQAISSRIPYVFGVGDHEEGRQHTQTDDQLQNGYDYESFMARFGLTTNSGQTAMARKSLSPTLHYFSFNTRLVHWIYINTNAYIHHQLYWLTPIQYKWLEQDLQSVDRTKTPWVFLSEHRSMYCVKTTDNECNSEAASIRDGIPRDAFLKNINAELWPTTPQTDRVYGIEELMLKYNVDMVFSGHTHHYQRSWPVIRENPVKLSYNKPGAPVYVVAGICGVEGPDKFELPMAKWEAFRDTEYRYSYGHLRVHNATHATYMQRLASNNSVFDEFTISRDPPPSPATAPASVPCSGEVPSAWRDAAIGSLVMNVVCVTLAAYCYGSRYRAQSHIQMLE